MTPFLADFLTKLFDPLSASISVPEKHDEFLKVFREYLDAVGVEHYNIAGFAVVDETSVINGFNLSTMPAPFQEEFVNELAQDDLVARMACGINDQKPVAYLDIGLDCVDAAEAIYAPTGRVWHEIARTGFGAGRALMGQLPGEQDGDKRCFGFALAGAPDEGARVRASFPELEIAAFALLDRMRPRFEAQIDGFDYNLTAREKDVLASLAAGHQRQVIAYRNGVSLPTVDLHLRNLRRKLSATTLAEAVAKGYRYGIL